MLTTRAGAWIALAAGLGACATKIDPVLVAETAHIRVLDKPPRDCRYAGDAVSYQMMSPGLDVFQVRRQQADIHEAELRRHAKSLGANAVYPHYIHDTGLFVRVQVNVFYAC